MRLRECSVCGWHGPRRRMWRDAPGVYVCRSEEMCAFRHRLRWHAKNSGEIEAQARANALRRYQFSGSRSS